MGVVLGGVLILHFSRSPLRDTWHSDARDRLFPETRFFQKTGFLNVALRHARSPTLALIYHWRGRNLSS
ncbi:MAG: hypothetical protein P5678_24330, partial [Limnospira sp. PMC 1240.20]|uniref:hypothetical protein n=1 Tax=unclassified Limnospira TaxID=2642885 RepID=UPI0028E0F4A0